MTPQSQHRAFPRLAVALQFCLLVLLLQTSILAQQSEFREENLAVSVEGKVSVKRKGFSNFMPVVFGTGFRSGDVLRLGESSHIKIVCSDLTLHVLDPGVAPIPCKVTQPLLQRPDGSMINPTRSWNDGSFPIILSPRKTRILSPFPLLRWTPVEGATIYKVTVRGMDLDWPTLVSATTETVYPGTAPALKPDVDYKLIVETGGRSSAEEPGLGLGFSILSKGESDTVLQQEQQIKSLKLPNGATQFVIAHLYATHGLKAEAIQRLEGLSQTLNVAAVSRLLADLYLETGVARKAEAFYSNSLVLSKAESDEEGEMFAHLALARIYDQALGNKKSATEHLEAALALATMMGDDVTTGQAKKKLAELKGTRTSKPD